MKTFNDWSSLGYKIKKGSKATWVNGVAMFSSSQVERLTKSYYPPASIYNPYPFPVEKPYDEPKIIYYADGSGYVEGRGPCGPLYFDYNGNT